MVAVMRISTGILFLMALAGCSVKPSKSIIEGEIVKYFEDSQYKVLDIRIGDIREIPLGEQQYMGTEGYEVYVPSITLEFTRDIGEPWNYKKGQHITSTGAVITIKRKLDAKNEPAGWIIAEISGIAFL